MMKRQRGMDIEILHDMGNLVVRHIKNGLIFTKKHNFVCFSAMIQIYRWRLIGMWLRCLFKGTEIKFQSNGTTVYFNKWFYMHRKDGPALIVSDSDTQIYLRNGVIHREDGPARMKNLDNKFDWIYNGKVLTFEEWAEKSNCSNEEIVKLKLEYC